MSHSVATRNEAIRLREAGWSLRGIQDVLAHRDISVSTSTIYYWTSEASWDRRRHQDRGARAARRAQRASYRWPGVARSDAWLLGRMRVLAGAGLSANAIAKVVAIDHGVTLSHDQVRHAVRSGSLHALQKAAA